jgi:biopolymer transport protein ExbD
MAARTERAIRGSRALRAWAEVNVTPLIDVLLVLLIIFMAALPITQRGLDVNLPETEKRAPTPAPTPQILLEYAADRRITINTTPVEIANLERRLREIFETRRDRTLFVRGDGTLRYGDIITVIDAARGAGVTRVGVVTDGALAMK